MSLIADRISKAAESRRYRPGYGPPDSLRKMAAWTFNGDEDAKWDEAAETTTLGALSVGDSFKLAAPDSTATHGIVKYPERNGLVCTDCGSGDRYLPATTTVQATAPV
jgi:hypothetical protein